MSEYLSPQPDYKLPSNVHLTIPDKSDPTWTHELYENSLHTDSVFDRFAKRVSYESQQCLRYYLSIVMFPPSFCNFSYDLQGIPLPYAKDSVFDKLFPVPSPKSTTLSQCTVSSPTKPTYSPTSDLIPPCSICQSPRTFECQLMPNLINVLKQPSNSRESSQEGKTGLETTLKGGDGMSWGTAMIFSCQQDCCFVDDKEAKECWTEEVVVVQWDT